MSKKRHKKKQLQYNLSDYILDNSCHYFFCFVITVGLFSNYDKTTKSNSFKNWSGPFSTVKRNLKSRRDRPLEHGICKKRRSLVINYTKAT